MLVEIDIESWSGRELTDEQLHTLRTHSISAIEVDARAPRQLAYGCYPILPPKMLGEFPGAKIRRIIENEGTRALLAGFEQRTTTVVNERCNVVVPGLGLLAIDTALVERDLCTEELQRRLDKGWRIVAVCVQPDQRRPDYVLGLASKGRGE